MSPPSFDSNIQCLCTSLGPLGAPWGPSCRPQEPQQPKALFRRAKAQLGLAQHQARLRWFRLLRESVATPGGCGARALPPICPTLFARPCYFPLVLRGIHIAAGNMSFFSGRLFFAREDCPRNSLKVRVLPGLAFKGEPFWGKPGPRLLGILAGESGLRWP